MDFLVVTGVALGFLLVSWVYGRVLSAGRPLNAFKKRILVYGFMFVLGTGYLMLIVADLHWSKELLFPMIGVWGAVVALVAWWRYRRGIVCGASGQRPPPRGG